MYLLHAVSTLFFSSIHHCFSLFTTVLFPSTLGFNGFQRIRFGYCVSFYFFVVTSTSLWSISASRSIIHHLFFFLILSFILSPLYCQFGRLYGRLNPGLKVDDCWMPPSLHTIHVCALERNRLPPPPNSFFFNDISPGSAHPHPGKIQFYCSCSFFSIKNLSLRSKAAQVKVTKTLRCQIPILILEICFKKLMNSKPKPTFGNLKTA